VEQRDRPELRGRPVVVGGSQGRGVVSAASYEARRYGIHSAMPGSRAAQLCPEAVFVRGRIDHYAEVGRQVREIFHRYTPVVQPLSLDEAFLDVKGSIRLFGPAASIGRQIKKAIRDELQLNASVGVAPVKFVAKIASDLNKPDGFVEVQPGEVQTFLDPLPISRLWGVGRVGEKRLTRLGLSTMKDLRMQSKDEMSKWLGSWGVHLWKLASGIDSRSVVSDRKAKQISHERTFHDDISDEEILRAVVSFLCESVARRLRNGGRQCRCVSLKYRREDFKTFARSATLPYETDSTDAVFRTAIGLLEKMRQREPRPVRLVGVSVGSLTSKHAARQPMLFDLEEGDSERRVVDGVVDQLQDKLGSKTIHRGTSHRWVRRGD
ncbi:MAG: DNA polymerase IV, partial [Planctomycetota bacterium]